jgi:hypothetical protein
MSHDDSTSFLGKDLSAEYRGDWDHFVARMGRSVDDACSLEISVGNGRSSMGRQEKITLHGSRPSLTREFARRVAHDG